MLFQKPNVVFIEIASEMVTITSQEQADIESCEGDGVTITRERYCQIMHHTNSDDQKEYCSTFPDTSKGMKILEGNAQSAVKEAIAPSATVAPMRSAPHFNNDLFK